MAKSGRAYSHHIDDLIVWKHRIRGAESAAMALGTARPNPVVLTDEVVASIFSPGIFFAADRLTGRKLWSVHADDLAGDPVTANEGNVFAVSCHSLYSLDAATGGVNWKFSPRHKLRESLYAGAAIAQRRLFIGDTAGHLSCVDVDSGSVKWKKSPGVAANSSIIAPPLIAENLVIVSTNTGMVVAYDLGNGERVWRTRLGGVCKWEPLRFRDAVVLSTFTHIYLLDWRTGEGIQQWRCEGRKTIAVTDETIVAVISDDKKSAAVDGALEPKGTAQIIGFRDGEPVFRRRISQYTWAIRWDPNTRFLYECRTDGLGIIAPDTGYRVHNISTGRLGMPCVPDIVGQTIYVLTMNGTLCAIRHP
jgi:PQQ-like domain